MTSPGPGESWNSLRPPWPVPTDLAGDVQPPPMIERSAFVAESIRRYGDDELLAGQRWNAVRRLLSDGDMNGFSGTGENTGPENRVLAAWLLTPREDFLLPEMRQSAYLPNALPLGHGQTISAPYMVTRMTSALNPSPSHAVLEIGTGSGYQAAMLSVLSSDVRTIETVPFLASKARQILSDLGTKRPWLDRIRVRLGNGYDGWSDGAPYDRIVVTCAIDHIPPALLEQLAPGGILILPLGPSRIQALMAIRRRIEGESAPPGRRWTPLDGIPGVGKFDISDVYGDGTRVRFVPFVY
ncbi:MAG: protein-L-isoaspartate O-methyltransferase [Spirochaetaceae bacterium]|nr:protein-L-isoaspartate O-methyltransferase [Spirochaetaceae bacterium]MDT8298749.1 protein-L-isoaspartate O-methyltransferase [Spirochaetaceae bacterium]